MKKCIECFKKNKIRFALATIGIGWIWKNTFIFSNWIQNSFIKK